MNKEALLYLPKGLFIGGAWQAASDTAQFDVLNPATEEVLASVASAAVPDALLALAAAQGAATAWAARPPRERGEILRRAYELMIDRTDYFAQLITLENGKSLADSRAEVTYAAEFFRWFSEEAVRNIGQVSQAPKSGARILVQHKAAGICVLITPWNYPAAMATRKIAPALAAGCTVILKPAAETPLTALALMPLLEEAGVPPGVINLLPSDKPGELVHALLHDPRVRVVSFTGSTKVGIHLLRESADNVIRSAMELGGNAPFIVFEDADIDKAVEGAMIAKMRNQGEACTAANRFYVHDQVHDLFVERLTQRMASLKMGSGLESGIDLGPMISAAAVNKIQTLVDDALAKGARLTTGGKALNRTGYFFPPTVLTDIPHTADILRHEIFGPVAAIQRFTDEDEVIARSNNTEYGLIAYVYTQNLSRGLRCSEQLEFGMVGLNRGLVSDPAAPFGGMKQSGLGREGGHDGILEFLETQYISVEW